MTLLASRVSETVEAKTRMVTSPPCVIRTRSSPTAKLVPKTGIVTPGFPKVPRIVSVLFSSPLLKIRTAEAPAASAFLAFSSKVHVPR
jgi:uncharacterized membrane protein